MAGDGETWRAGINKDGTRILTVNSREVKTWDVASGKSDRPPIRFKCDGETTFSGSGRASSWELTITDRERKKKLHHIFYDWASLAFAELPLDAALHYSTPDRSQGLVADVDGTLQLWDLAAGQPLGEKAKAPGEITAVQSSREGRLLLSYKDKTVQLWKTSPALLAAGPAVRLESALGPPSFTADGRGVIAMGEHDAIRMWNVGADGLTQPKILDPGTGSRAFNGTRITSPTGKYVVAGERT